MTCLVSLIYLAGDSWVVAGAMQTMKSLVRMTSKQKTGIISCGL